MIPFFDYAKLTTSRLLLCILLLIAIYIPSVAQVALTLPEEKGHSGDIKTLSVQVSDITDLDITAYELSVRYDSTIIRIEQIRHEDTITPDEITYNTNFPDQVKISFATDLPMTGEGVLLFIDVTLLNQGMTELSTANARFFADASGQPEEIIPESTEGTVTVDIEPSVPELVSPMQGAEQVPTETELIWNESLHSDMYHLQLANDPDFSQIHLDADSLMDTSHEVHDLDHETTYYWRVRGRNDGGPGPFSDHFIFTTEMDFPGAPELVSPTNEDPPFSEPDTITFTWTSSEPNVLSYELDISMEESLDQVLLSFENLTDTTYSVSDLWDVLPELDNDLTLYWRVRAVNDRGSGPFSETGSFGLRTPTGTVPEANHPTEYQLNQNYPNPFNPSTQIRFHLPYKSKVQLEVYNTLGQRVQTIINSEMQTGTHSAVWDTANQSVPSGIYLLRMSAVPLSGESQRSIQLTRSMVLVN